MTKKVAQRAALATAPTIGYFEDGKDAYVTMPYLRKLVLDGATRWWTFHKVPTTVELPRAAAKRGQRYAKLWDRFTEHGEEHQLLELLREYRDCGVERPGGYADVFHSLHKSPFVPWSVNASLAPAFAGGWQDALRVGVHPGKFYKYDMRSAYLWAGSLGLPDTKTYRRSTSISADNPGVYRVKLEHAVRDAPFPFNRSRECLASSEEIECYSLPVVEVISGVTWTRTLDPAKLVDSVRAVSTWKQAGRSYWGRWGQTSRVTCHAGGKAWTLPNISANIPWAHLIVSRVKNKLWNYSTDALHVYVDSVITPHTIPTGEGIGDWKLEKVYENGVVVKGPGQYGDMTAHKLERMAGVPKDSRLRDMLANKYLELLAD